jgi:cyclic phosphodiesterase-like protein
MRSAAGGGGSGRRAGGRAERCSVWLVPAGAPARRLRALVDRLARRCGSPRFDPHVTLLGGLRLDPAAARPALERLAAAIAGRGRLVVRLGGADSEAPYFRAVFVSVVLDRRLLATRRAAVRLLGPGRKAGFRPHLSVLYGRLPPSLRRRIVVEIGDRMDGLLRIARLDLVRTGRDVRRWRLLASVRLGVTP